MRPDRRAVIFDLDDTLYPLRRFVLSGFAAAARHLERARGLDGRAVFAELSRAMRTHRGHELQVLAHRRRLPPSIVPDLVTVIRGHQPRLRLPRQTAYALGALRRGWQLGIVTNGFPDIQARKVRALGLDLAVDTVVYASEHGSGAGKPDREPFLEALARLGVAPDRAVFVGDDERCDLFGAGRIGMFTVYLGGWRRRPVLPRACCADAMVASLADVPDVAKQLVDERWKHVA